MNDQDLASSVGERMRIERMRLGVTQAELATKLGIRQQTIVQYEKGTTSPTLQFLYKLQTCGFNLQYLLYGRQHVPKPTDFPPEIFQFAVDMVNEIEQKFSNGSLSNDAKLRAMLIILGKYVEEPSSIPLSDSQAMDLLIRG